MYAHRKRFTSIMVVALTVLLMSAVGSAAAEKKVVRFGLLPYQDWMPWTLADELGYFDEVGLDVQFTKFPDDVTVGEALESGELDIACTNSASGPLLAARFPRLRVVSLACGFTGYAIMVRPDDVYPKGKIKTYQQFYEEFAKSNAPEEAHKKAVYATCKQLEGRSIVMDRGTGSNLPLQAALAAANLKDNQVKYIDIPDVEGALAFWKGTGDFELGGYPQVVSLSKLGAKKLISARELGGVSVILSGEMARADWVEKNIDTIVKMRKVWYRMINDIYTKPEMLERFAAIANKWQGTSLTANDVKVIMGEITYWPSQEEVADYFFAPGATWNVKKIYRASLDFWTNIKKQIKPGSVDLDKFIIAEEIHKKVNEAR